MIIKQNNIVLLPVITFYNHTGSFIIVWDKLSLEW